MAVSNDLVKHLRQITGSSITLCKKILEEVNGDMERALAALKKSSEVLASKKESRVTGSGLVETYLHGNRRIGVLLELRCETDFVARNPEFQALAHDLALHIAASNPLYVSKDNIPEIAYEEAKRLFMEEAENLGKSLDMTEKIVAGKLETHFQDTSLLTQLFVKDSTITVEELIKRSISHFGEKIEVARFARFAL